MSGVNNRIDRIDARLVPKTFCPTLVPLSFLRFDIRHIAKLETTPTLAARRKAVLGLVVDLPREQVPVAPLRAQNMRTYNAMARNSIIIGCVERKLAKIGDRVSNYHKVIVEHGNTPLGCHKTTDCPIYLLCTLWYRCRLSGAGHLSGIQGTRRQSIDIRGYSGRSVSHHGPPDSVWHRPTLSRIDALYLNKKNIPQDDAASL